jgi:hypothetical protein
MDKQTIETVKADGWYEHTDGTLHLRDGRAGLAPCSRAAGAKGGERRNPVTISAHRLARTLARGAGFWGRRNRKWHRSQT